MWGSFRGKSPTLVLAYSYYRRWFWTDYTHEKGFGRSNAQNQQIALRMNGCMNLRSLAVLGPSQALPRPNSDVGCSVQLENHRR
jgi:hypothetical protein